MKVGQESVNRKRASQTLRRKTRQGINTNRPILKPDITWLNRWTLWETKKEKKEKKLPEGAPKCPGAVNAPGETWQTTSSVERKRKSVSGACSLFLFLVPRLFLNSTPDSRKRSHSVCSHWPRVAVEETSWVRRKLRGKILFMVDPPTNKTKGDDKRRREGFLIEYVTRLRARENRG